MGYFSTQVTQRYVHVNDEKLAEQVDAIKIDSADLVRALSN